MRFFIGSLITVILLMTISNFISGFMQDNVTPYEVIINHIFRMPGQFSKIVPIAVLIASLFTVNKLINSNELTALFSLGLTRVRFFTTVLGCASIIAIFQFIMTGYIQPLAHSKGQEILDDASNKFKNLNSKGIKAKTSLTGKTWYKSEHYFFSFYIYDSKKHKLFDASYYYIDQKESLIKKITAKEVIHIENNRWLFIDAKIYTHLNDKTFPQLESFDKIELELEEVPKDFNQIESDINTLVFHDLYTYVKKLSSAGLATSEYELVLLNNVSSMLITIIFSIFAAIGVFNPNRRASSFGKNVVFIFAFSLSYWLIYSSVIEMGNNGRIPSYVAAFCVPSLFLMFLTYYFIRNRNFAR